MKNLCSPESADFFEKLKAHAARRGQGIDAYFRAVFSGQKNKEAFNGWRRRQIFPRADDAFMLAQDLGITVEELIAGAEGAEYVRAWARNSGGVWEPPERIADIVKGLSAMGDRELSMIRAVIAAAGEGTVKK